MSSGNYSGYTYPQVTLHTGMESGIATVSFNNPESLNAIYPEAISELAQLMRQLKDETTIKVIVFVGAGEKAFIAGADIKRMAKMSAEEAWKFGREGQEMLSALEDLPQVTIAAVNGFALGGGCELMLACDIAYASSKAKFGQPEVSLGLIPGFGGTVRLMRRVGIGKARELIFTGVTINAEQALACGLVDGVFPAENLSAEVIKMAMLTKSRSPYAIARCKESIRFAAAHDRDTALQFEAELFSACFNHADRKEGTEAFIAKRQANWHTEWSKK